MAHVFVFAFDLTEASQIRRIRSLQRLGHDVQSAAFRRGNMSADFVPDWHNFDLGYVENERYGKRLMGILRGIWRIARQRKALLQAEIVIARNFDLLVIAWASRMLSGAGRVPLVYECLDIHRLFTWPGWVGATMRWCERRLLKRVQLLIVSSPGFIHDYFQKIQGYRGPHSIIENKLWFEGSPVPRPETQPIKTINAPLNIGWVGSIRCAPSFKLLMSAADQLGESVSIRIHGNVHYHVLPDFDEQAEARGNVAYIGPYDYPSGLAAVYGECDVVWAQDLWQRGNNSDWLLPNRIYEASWFGCPSIAVADTETGRKVALDKLGFTIEEPSSEALVALLENLNHSATAEASARLLEKPDAAFMLRPQDVQVALDPVLSETPKDRL